MPIMIETESQGGRKDVYIVEGDFEKDFKKFQSVLGPLIVAKDLKHQQKMAIPVSTGCRVCFFRQISQEEIDQAEKEYEEAKKKAEEQRALGVGGPITIPQMRIPAFKGRKGPGN